MKHDDGQLTSEARERAQDEIAEAARFPEENPNPVFRVNPDGRLLYANPASRPLLAAWRLGEDVRIPRAWLERVAGALAAGEPCKWDEDFEGRIFQLTCVPIAATGYVNIYGADVTERVALENQLRESETQAHELIRHAPTGIYEVDFRTSRFRTVNDAMCQVLGYTRDELLATDPFDLLDDEGKALFADRIRRTSAGEQVDPAVEYRVRKKDGSAVYAVLSTRITYTSGRPDGAFVIAHDVTERRRAAEELAGQREQLRDANGQLQEARDQLEQRVQERTAELEAIFASVPDALYVTDRTGIVRANEAALASFGARNVEEMQQGLAALGGRQGARYCDTGLPVPRDDILLARALRGERTEREMIVRLSEGGDELILRSAGAPIIVDGKITGAVGIATNITEQKRREAQLAYQAMLLENVNEAIFAYDGNMCVTAWNKRAEQQYGWKAEEAIGAHALDVVGSRTPVERQGAPITEIAATGCWQGELEHTRRDGTPIVVEATVMRLCDEAGNGIGFVTVNRDITERKKADDELRASREQLRTLSRRLVTMQEAERSYVADQLYNQAGQVLAALQMQLARLGREGGRESPAALLPTMQATVNEAMRELHELARQLRPVGLDRSTLAGVLSTHLAEFGRAHELGVEFRAGGNEGLRLPADVATAIFRVVQEGLTNVARHAQASEVILSMSRDRDRLTVALVDNGVGFEPGAGPVTNGLGLASMRERLEIVGGRLTIESGSAGTALFIDLPLHSEELPK